LSICLVAETQSWVSPVLLSSVIALIPLWWYIADRNEYTNSVLYTGWMPVIGAMVISRCTIRHCFDADDNGASFGDGIYFERFRRTLLIMKIYSQTTKQFLATSVRRLYIYIQCYYIFKCLLSSLTFASFANIMYAMKLLNFIVWA
jgi:hypothetical protein